MADPPQLDAPSTGPRPAPGSGPPPLLLVGTDHRCSPLELRERVAYSGEAAEELMVHLLARPEIEEAALISTCNRTEVYVHPRPGADAYPAVLSLAFTDRAPEMASEGRLYVRRGTEAARHLMAVAAGLESMVLGEPEILGQVKQAAGLAEAVGSSGTLLRRLFRSAVKAGSRSRSETALSAGAVSLGYAAIELTRAIFSRIESARVLMVGAGETAHLVSRNLLERGARELTVTNRSPERTRSFVETFPMARPLDFDQRSTGLRSADLVVVTTGAPEPVVTARDLAAALPHRGGRPLLAIDLGVPRNVEPEAARLENVFLHDLDSLDVLIQRNLKRRREEVPAVEEILDQELAHFLQWYRGLSAEPLVAELQRQAEGLRRRELAAALERFPEDTHEDLDRLTRALVRKILHHPSVRLRQGGDGELPRLDLVRELFRLGDRDGD